MDPPSPRQEEVHIQSGLIVRLAVLMGERHAGLLIGELELLINILQNTLIDIMSLIPFCINLIDHIVAAGAYSSY